MSTRRRNKRHPEGRRPSAEFVIGMIFGAVILIVTVLTINFALEQGKQHLTQYCESQGTSIDLARF